MKISVCPKCYEKGTIAEGTFHSSGYPLFIAETYRCPMCKELYNERLEGVSK